MKKFFKGFLVLVLCACSLLGFTACDDKKLSETTNVTTGVVSNNGVVVYYDNWLYFINGTKTVNEENVKSKNIRSAIYRVRTDLNGQPEYKADTSGEDKEKEFATVEKLVTSLTGFEEGSLFLAGNFLYFATPCSGRDKDGNMLYNKVEFKRYDLVSKKIQSIYTTIQSSEDTISYEYYKMGADLYLVVYEKTNATVTSLKIGTKMSTAFVKEDVTSCVLSENFGEGYKGGITDNYIYYTMSYDENSTVREGSRVFRILPDGTQDDKTDLISEGHSVSLITIKGDHLIYSESSSSSTITFAQKVVKGTSEAPFKLSFDRYNDAILFISVEDVIYLEEEGKIHALVFDSGWIRKYVYTDGKLDLSDVYMIKEMGSSDQIDFIGIDDESGYLIYQLTSSKASSNTNSLYKLKMSVEEGEERVAVRLSKTKLDSAKGMLAPEIYNGYVYGMFTDSTYNTTYLYRINLITAKERGEKDDDGVLIEIDDAEFVGVKE